MLIIKVFKVKYFMLIKYGFCVFKTLTFVFRVLIITTSACSVHTSSKIQDFFAKTQSHKKN